MSRTLRVYGVADIHSPDSFEMPQLDPQEWDVVLTLGDIGEATIDYVLLRGRGVPLFGVPGNHDPKETPGLTGWRDLHRRMTTVQEWRVGGFGGAPKYKDHPNHFTERQVARAMRWMPPVDIFISHAPPRATSQNEDRVHRGFEAFDAYIERCQPRYWLHGHLDRDSRDQVGSTTVIGIVRGRPLKLVFEDDYVPKAGCAGPSLLEPARWWVKSWTSR